MTTFSGPHVSLAEEWPPVARRLVRSLRARGVDPYTSEDIAQEVALRALKTGVPFTSSADLGPWANRVGHRLATDDWRRWGKRVSCTEVPEAIAPQDVATEVELRSALDAVAEECRGLALVDREAIAYKVGGRSPEDKEEATRWNDRRRRARETLRRRLDDVLDGLVAAFVVARHRAGRVRARLGVDRLAELLGPGGHALLASALQATVVLMAPMADGGTARAVGFATVPAVVSTGMPRPVAPPAAGPSSGTSARGGARPAAGGASPASRPTLEVSVPGPPRPTGGTRGRVDDDGDEWLVCVNRNCIRPPLPKDPPVPLPVNP